MCVEEKEPIVQVGRRSNRNSKLSSALSLRCQRAPEKFVNDIELPQAEAYVFALALFECKVFPWIQFHGSHYSIVFTFTI